MATEQVAVQFSQRNHWWLSVQNDIETKPIKEFQTANLELVYIYGKYPKKSTTEFLM